MQERHEYEKGERSKGIQAAYEAWKACKWEAERLHEVLRQHKLTAEKADKAAAAELAAADAAGWKEADEEMEDVGATKPTTEGSELLAEQARSFNDARAAVRSAVDDVFETRLTSDRAELATLRQMAAPSAAPDASSALQATFAGSRMAQRMELIAALDEQRILAFRGLAELAPQPLGPDFKDSWVKRAQDTVGKLVAEHDQVMGVMTHQQNELLAGLTAPAPAAPAQRPEAPTLPLRFAQDPTGMPSEEHGLTEEQMREFMLQGDEAAAIALPKSDDGMDEL